MPRDADEAAHAKAVDLSMFHGFVSSPARHLKNFSQVIDRENRVAVPLGSENGSAAAGVLGNSPNPVLQIDISSSFAVLVRGAGILVPLRSCAV